MFENVFKLLKITKNNSYNRIEPYLKWKKKLFIFYTRVVRAGRGEQWGPQYY